jgi:hypothetical protein
MLSFKGFNLMEAGQAAGKLELVKINLDTARKFASSQFAANGKTLDSEIPNFEKNFLFAQKQAGTGRTQRKDMPVIDNKDVRAFQQRLKNGSIDINAPLAKETNKSNPFPEGLSGAEAKKWLENGLESHDGKKGDDRVKVSDTKVAVGQLKPIQKQIYFDKALIDTAKFGAKGSTDFLTGPNNKFIISADNYIIDGHHRYLAGILIDPKMKVPVLKIDLPISKLLPMTLAYGDAIGNKRNA